MTAVAAEPAATASTAAPAGAARFAWFGYLAAAMLVAVATRLIAPAAAAVSDAVVTMSSLAAFAVGMRWHRPVMNVVWRRFLVALWLYVAASVCYAVAPSGAVTWLLVAAAIHTVGWAWLVSGMLLVVRTRTPGGDRDGVLDALVVTLSAGIAAWTLIFQPVLAYSAVALVERVVVVYYPVLDLFAIPLLVRMIVGGGKRTTSLRLLLVAFVSATVANAVFAYLTWQDASTSSVSLLYPIGFALVGAAVLHPSMVDIARPGELPRRPAVGLRCMLLTCAASVPAALLWVRWLRGLGVTVTMLSLGTVMLFVLVGYRMWTLVTEVERLTVRRGEERFQALVHHAADVIVVLDADGRVASITPSVQRWGHQIGAVVGRPLRELVHDDDAHAWLASIVAAGPDGADSLHGRVVTGAGDWREVDVAVSALPEGTDSGGVVLTLHDVTDRNRLRRELTRRTERDLVTGLPNRVRFHAALRRAAASRDAAGLGVLFIDIDDFKRFNDSLGETAGDRILVAIAHRLRAVAPVTDTVARLGSDEFAVLVTSDVTLDGCERLAGRLLRAIEAPIAIEDRQVVVQASVGVAVSASPVDATGLLRDADTAIYAAKARGRGRLQVFDPDLLRAVRRRQDLLAALPFALEAGQFRLAYQPIVRLDDGHVVAVEALLRWEHPQLGAVAPLDFIPLAEETGEIQTIGRWVLLEACRTAAAWQRMPEVQALRLSVNLSVAQLRDATLVDEVAAALQATGLRPDDLLLEVTESMLARSDATCRLESLRELGVRIAVDDFGTGYSSLRYLQQFPLDVLKIDRSFVDVVAADPTLTGAILGLASSLGLQAVAEGIETAEQVTALQALGCELGQGFRFARPGPASEVTAMLQRRAAADALSGGSRVRA